MNTPKLLHRLRTPLAFSIPALFFPALLSAQTTLFWGGGTDTPVASVDSTSVSGNAGNWDNSITNWNTSTSATIGWQQAWEAGALAIIKQNYASSASTAITLTDNIEVGGIDLQYTTPNRVNQGYTINGASAFNITLSEGATLANNSTSSSSALAFGSNAILAGTNGFNTNGHVSLQSASTVSGAVTITGGATYQGLTLTSGGSLLNIDSFDVGPGNRLSFTNAASGNGSNSLKDTATVKLRNGLLQFTNTNSGTVTETLGKVILEGSGHLIIASSGRTLTLADGIERGSTGKGVLTSSIGTATNFGSGTNIVLGNTAATTLLPYAINTSGTNDVRFLSVDGSGVLQALAVEAADTVNPWTYNDASKNLQLITGATTTLSAFTQDVTLGTLAVGMTAAGTTTLDFGGHTLTTQAVAMAINGDRNSHLIIGNTAADKITSSTGELYLIHDKNNNFALTATTTLKASVTDSGSTPVSLIIGGASGRFSLSGVNTHTGKTYIAAYDVTLSSTGSLLTTSELNISSGSTFTANSANQAWGDDAIAQTVSGGGTYVAGTRTVTIGADGTLAPGETLTFSFTTGKLSFDAGSIISLTLGTVGDSIAFTTADDWLLGSGNFALNVTGGAGFEHGVAYTVLSNVTTAGFTPGSVLLDGNLLTSGDDYTWGFADNAYSLTFLSNIPEPSSYAVLTGLCALGFVGLRRRR